MKLGIFYCAILALLTLSYGLEPRLTRQERIAWINAKSNYINKAIVLFDECQIRKTGWSNKRRYITIVGYEASDRKAITEGFKCF